jgi:hypothetical protein
MKTLRDRLKAEVEGVFREEGQHYSLPLFITEDEKLCAKHLALLVSMTKKAAAADRLVPPPMLLPSIF